jgi:hypothetical protein
MRTKQLTVVYLLPVYVLSNLGLRQYPRWPCSPLPGANTGFPSPVTAGSGPVSRGFVASPHPHASLRCPLTEVRFGSDVGPTLATITDGGVIRFTGTVRPVWLDLICLPNQPGVLNALENPGAGQCSHSTPSGPVLPPTVVTTVLAGQCRTCPVPQWAASVAAASWANTYALRHHHVSTGWQIRACLFTSFCSANIARQPFARHIRFRSCAVISLSLDARIFLSKMLWSVKDII